MINIILILVIFFAVALAGLFSGAETGIYQLSRIRLRIGVEKKQLLSIMLSKIMDDGGSLLASILIGTNLAYYIITSLVTYMLMNVLDDKRFIELIVTVLTAPVLFVLAELIPKNIFFYRADSLMPYAAPALMVSEKIFRWCGLNALLRMLSGMFARLSKLQGAADTKIKAAQRHQVSVLFRETREEGFLSTTQTEIMRRLADIDHLSIASVMTPGSGTIAVDINSDREALLSKLKSYPFTRLPVFEQQRNNIIGFINIYEALTFPRDFSDLRLLLTPIRELSAETNVLDAIGIMQNENQKIILVTAATGHPSRTKAVGILTMKDLVEELVGELSEW